MNQTYYLTYDNVLENNVTILREVAQDLKDWEPEEEPKYECPPYYER